jgi:hypothetical protein
MVPATQKTALHLKVTNFTVGSSLQARAPEPPTYSFCSRAHGRADLLIDQEKSGLSADNSHGFTPIAGSLGRMPGSTKLKHRPFTLLACSGPLMRSRFWRQRNTVGRRREFLARHELLSQRFKLPTNQLIGNAAQEDMPRRVLSGDDDQYCVRGFREIAIPTQGVSSWRFRSAS